MSADMSPSAENLCEVISFIFTLLLLAESSEGTNKVSLLVAYGGVCVGGGGGGGVDFFKSSLTFSFFAQNLLLSLFLLMKCYLHQRKA